MKLSKHLDILDHEAIDLGDSIAWSYWALSASSPNYRAMVSRLFASWARERLRVQARAVIDGCDN